MGPYKLPLNISWLIIAFARRAFPWHRGPRAVTVGMKPLASYEARGQVFWEAARPGARRPGRQGGGAARDRRVDDDGDFSRARASQRQGRARAPANRRPKPRAGPAVYQPAASTPLGCRCVAGLQPHACMHICSSRRALLGCVGTFVHLQQPASRARGVCALLPVPPSPVASLHPPWPLLVMGGWDVPVRACRLRHTWSSKGGRAAVINQTNMRAGGALAIQCCATQITTSAWCEGGRAAGAAPVGAAPAVAGGQGG